MANDEIISRRDFFNLASKYMAGVSLAVAGAGSLMGCATNGGAFSGLSASTLSPEEEIIQLIQKRGNKYGNSNDTTVAIPIEGTVNFNYYNVANENGFENLVTKLNTEGHYKALKKFNNEADGMIDAYQNAILDIDKKFIDVHGTNQKGDLNKLRIAYSMDMHDNLTGKLVNVGYTSTGINDRFHLFAIDAKDAYDVLRRNDQLLDTSQIKDIFNELHFGSMSRNQRDIAKNTTNITPEQGVVLVSYLIDKSNVAANLAAYKSGSIDDFANKFLDKKYMANVSMREMFGHDNFLYNGRNHAIQLYLE